MEDLLRTGADGAMLAISAALRTILGELPGDD
jgi:hypothetical protein